MAQWGRHFTRWRSNVWGSAKPLWARKYPVNEKNQIELACEPILIQFEGKNYLIDSGVGFNKLTENSYEILA